MAVFFKKQIYYKVATDVAILTTSAVVADLFLREYIYQSITLIVCVFFCWHYVNSIKYINAVVQGYEFRAKTFGIWKIIKDEYNYNLVAKRYEHKHLLNFLTHAKKTLDELEQGILFCNLNHKIIWTNKVASKILKFDYKNAQKQNFLHINHAIKIRKFVTELIAGGDKNKSILFWQDGQNYYKIQGYKVDDIYLLFLENVTLEQVDKLRQNYLTSYLNHDLRTPLTVLSGYLEILTEDNGILGEAIEPMQAQVSKIKYLLDDLVQLENIENNATDVHSWVNFSQQILAIIKDVKKLYPQYPLEVDVANDVYVRGSELNLNRLATNLIYNAIKHNPENTHINIKLEKCTKGIKFEVKDDGVGINKEHIPYLTLRFYKVDKARDTSVSQSGLGLAIVKHILNTYEAKLAIQSDKFQGSTFSFSIPFRYVEFQKPNAQSTG